MRHVTRIHIVEEKKNAYSFLVGKSEGKRPLGRFRLKWKENIKTNPEEV